MIAMPIRAKRDTPTEVALEYWRSVLQRRLERQAVIDWTLEMVHPNAERLLRRVMREAGMVQVDGRPTCFECGPGTLDWILARKAVRA